MTPRNTKIFYWTVSLVSFKFLPDQTKFLSDQKYDNMKQQQVIDSSF